MVAQLKIICSGLLEKNNKFLLIKAKIGAPKGLWNLPGGRLEENENLDLAAIREVKEETGYQVKISGLVSVYQRIYEKLEDVVILTFKMSIVSGNLAFPEDEIKEAKWFTAEEIFALPDEKVASRVKESIKNYLNQGILKQKQFHLITDKP